MDRPDSYRYFLSGHDPGTDALTRIALEDVRDRSGLSSEILELAQVRIFSKDGDVLKERLGFASFDGKPILKVFRLIEVPYFSEDGKIILCRYKLIPGTTGRDGHAVKYLHPLDGPAIPYLLPGVWAAKDRPSVPVWITEGEKKTLKLIQHCRCCIGLSGIWNFKAGQKSDEKASKYLWQELERFDWTGRTVFLAFDMDLWTNPQVRYALYELALKLMAKGAIIRFPRWS